MIKINRRDFLIGSSIGIAGISGYAAFRNSYSETKPVASTSNLETPSDLSIRTRQKATIPIESFTINIQKTD